jgi:hypothetical protein
LGGGTTIRSARIRQLPWKIGIVCSAEIQTQNKTVEDAGLMDRFLALQAAFTDINIAKDRPIILNCHWGTEGGNLADTRMQLEVEDWVRRDWMPKQFGTKFSRERLPLRSGGVFDFDAVSEDHSIVATISTSGSKTSGGKYAVGKILKLRSDMLFLTMVEATQRLIVLTERDMCDHCEKEALGGRVPPEIKFVCALIPDELRTRLIAARLKASNESSGKAITE